MESIKQILMRRDGIDEEAALGLIREAQLQLQIYLEQGLVDEAENICEEYFGLETDYLLELLEF